MFSQFFMSYLFVRGELRSYGQRKTTIVHHNADKQGRIVLGKSIIRSLLPIGGPWWDVMLWRSLAYCPKTRAHVDKKSVGCFCWKTRLDDNFMKRVFFKAWKFYLFALARKKFIFLCEPLTIIFRMPFLMHIIEECA